MKLELRDKNGTWFLTDNIINSYESFKSTEDMILVRLNGVELLINSGCEGSDYDNLLKSVLLKGLTTNYIPELDMTTVVVDKYSILGDKNMSLDMGEGGPYVIDYYCGAPEDETTISYYKEMVAAIKAKYL